MTSVEKLARRICWLEFPHPTKGSVGKTEAEYWEPLRPEKKREYEQDAEWLCWMLDRLTRTSSSANLLSYARTTLLLARTRREIERKHEEKQRRAA